MKFPRPLVTTPTRTAFVRLPPNLTRVSVIRPSGVRVPATMATGSRPGSLSSSHLSSSQASASIFGSGVLTGSSGKLEAVEHVIEKTIYRFRFLTLLGVSGSLVGSLLCFIKGCNFVVSAFTEYSVNRAKVIMLLFESIDVYLLGTVMLVFGMGIYELFISNLDIAESLAEESVPHRSNLFGLFTLKERPKWLEIKSVDSLKTKLGHVIVMLLLIGLLEKSRKAVIVSPVDLLCFAASVFLSSCCLYLLSMLK